jgi:DNA-binding SARP family transcriptional activator
MEFRILGRLDVSFGGERIDTGPPKQRLVLGRLLLSANDAVSTERLIESIWWTPLAAAASNLRMYVTGIRRALQGSGETAPRLQTVRGGGYRLLVRPGELDLQRFEDLAKQADAAHGQGQLAFAADCLERALNLWRGPVLEGIAKGPALQSTATLIEERRIALAGRWTQLQLELRQPERALGMLYALVEEHPMRERLWGYLMLALCQSGSPGEALAVYARLRTILSEELGTNPGSELQRLHRGILGGDHVSILPPGGPRTSGRVLAPLRMSLSCDGPDPLERSIWRTCDPAGGIAIPPPAELEQ